MEQTPPSGEPYTVGAVLETGMDPSRVHKTLYSDNGEPVRFLVDSGSECNVIGLRDYERLSGDAAHVRLQNRVSVLRMYDGSEVATVGRARIRLRNASNGRLCMLTCRVVSKNVSPILSLSSSLDLGLLQVRDVDPLDYLPRMAASGGTPVSPTSVHSATQHGETVIDQSSIPVRSTSVPSGTPSGETMTQQPSSSLTANDVLREYQDVFDTASIGNVLSDYVIVTDPNVRPVADPPRRVRVHVRDKLKAKLDDLTQHGLITPVTGPTPWVSNLVVVDKPSGDIRLCLDPKSLNQAVLREHYPTPTIDEVTSRLSDAKVFSVVDASRAFWQVGLSKASADLCCFHTPLGRYRWERLPYGIKSAPEVWQRIMHELVSGLLGVEVIADDFVIYGCGPTREAAVRDHDKNLLAFLERARSRHLRLNPDKFRFKVSAVRWMGHVLSDKGLQVDPAKVQAITDLPVPTSVVELKRFLGMVGYLSRFVPNISEVLAPLRQLTQHKVDWFWSPACQAAFEKVKVLLTSAPVLRFYDPRREATVQCDASKAGLGAVLLQDGHPVMYCSRSLTCAEQAYSQIEKELLAIVFAMTRLDQFVYGRTVTVQSDHKPLEAIMCKPLGDAPLRLQRMLLALQRYDFTVVYTKGSLLFVADTLSRAALSDTAQSLCAVQLEQVDLTKGVSISPQRLALLRTATSTDPVLSRLADQILRGWPVNRRDVPEILAGYFPFRDELTTQDGLIFKGRCLVVPHSQQREVISQLHRTHIGLASILRLARECVFWLGMSSALRDTILKCSVCLAHRPEQPREPLMSHELPDRPWQKVATDLFELYNVTYCVLVDYYSNFVEVDRLASMSTAHVVKALSAQFARYGIPEVLISDNGPCYASAEFKAFTERLDIEHRTSSPGYPQSNGKAENAVRTVKRLFKKAIESGESPEWALLTWRNVPMEGVGVSPSQIMFGRPSRTFLPRVRSTLTPSSPESVQSALQSRKAKQARLYNRGTRSLRPLVSGQSIRMQLPGQSRWSVGVCVKPLSHRSYLVRVNGAHYRRNRRQLLATDEASPGDDLMAPGPSDFRPPQMPPSMPRSSAPPIPPAVPPGPGTCHAPDLSVASPQRVPLPCTPPRPDPPSASLAEPAPRRSSRESRPPPYLSDFVT